MPSEEIIAGVGEGPPCWESPTRLGVRSSRAIPAAEAWADLPRIRVRVPCRHLQANR